MTRDDYGPETTAGAMDTPGNDAGTAAVAFLYSVMNENLYRNNPFRLSGLPGDAEPEAYGRQRSAPEFPGFLPLEPAPDPSSVRTALNELREPVHRLVYELFWFTPTDANDRAWDALARNDTDRAAQIWVKRMAEDGIAAHNAAVLLHLRLLDTPDGGSAEDWEVALIAWRVALHRDELWDRLRTRAAQIDERLSNGSVVDELRRALPGALVRINTGLIVRAVSAGESSAAAPHIEAFAALAVNEQPYKAVYLGRDELDEARAGAARQLTAQLRSIADEARAVASERPEQACTAAQHMLDRAQAPLHVIDRLCPMPDRICADAREIIVDSGLFCNAQHFDTATNVRANVALLEQLGPLATGASRERLSAQRNKLVVRHVDYLCREARQTLDAGLRSGAGVGRDLLDLTLLPLEWSLSADGSDGPFTAQLRDRIVVVATECAVIERERSGDLATVEQLLIRISALSNGTESHEPVRRELDIVAAEQRERDMDLLYKCWFCRDRITALEKPYRVVVYNWVPYSSRRRTYVVEVPRCFACQDAQQPGDMRRELLGWANLFAMFGAMIAVGVGFLWHPAFVICAICLLVVIVAPLFRRRIDADVALRASRYPLVTEMRQQGWRPVWW